MLRVINFVSPPREIISQKGSRPSAKDISRFVSKSDVRRKEGRPPRI